jgi:hypothetical protein
LIEILIVISIVSFVYYLSIEMFAKKNTSVKKIQLEYLPKYLNKYEFSKTLSLKCINDGKKCFVYSDGNIVDNIEDLFTHKPIVYSYDSSLDIQYFDDIEIKKLDRNEVCFQYDINRYKKHSDMIVEVNNKIFMFNSFYEKAIKFEYLSDVSEYFDELKKEVRDAF